MFIKTILKIFLSGLVYAMLFLSCAHAGETIVTDKESFAKEFTTLKLLLQKVQDEDAAIFYKPQIEQELTRLKSSQLSGDEEFRGLSDVEKREFIKKYQNNHLHCGEVTQVMEERRRILLNPELYKILGPLVQNIP